MTSPNRWQPPPDSGDPAALKEALELYRELQVRTHDAAHQGWMEHFERDWTPLPIGDRNAIDTSKVWWVQAEVIAALTDGLMHQPGSTAYQEALLRTFQFVNAHMTDARTGIWLDTVTREGAPQSSGIAHNWKANYHDIRALVNFVRAFHPSPQAGAKSVGR